MGDTEGLRVHGESQGADAEASKVDVGLRGSTKRFSWGRLSVGDLRR